jgi:putative membrane protein
MTAVALSKIATKSENPEVKLFAEKMVRDHTAANSELTPIATAAGVEMPKTLDRDHQKVHDQLQSTHGKAFDHHASHGRGSRPSCKALSSRR